MGAHTPAQHQAVGGWRVPGPEGRRGLFQQFTDFLDGTAGEVLMRRHVRTAWYHSVLQVSRLRERGTTQNR